MTSTRSRSRIWSIILAGGEGERTRPLIERWLGSPVPKQYCAFVGTRSMLQHTWDRADQVAPPEQKITVIAQHHRQRLWSQLERQTGQLLLQPCNRDTAAGIFLPLTYVRAWDPTATVVVYPSDHFVYPEAPFIETVRRAVRATEVLSDRMCVLGVRPTGLMLDYGWIEVGRVLGWCGGSMMRQVQAFLEKPDMLRGLSALANGAFWNTLVIAANVHTLWTLGWRHLPELMERFEQLEQAVGTPQEGAVLKAIYAQMPCRNFSSDLLQRAADGIGVIELQDVLWSDWGRPERIVETLRVLGKEPAFPYELLGEPSLQYNAAGSSIDVVNSP